MERFEVNILGCGSALPTTKHFLSSQVVNLRDKLYMIDCGEGSQLQFRAMKLKFQRLNHIFISHLHGDHCFGLPGLISTLGLLGRTSDLHIYAQPDAPIVFQPLLDYFCKQLPYKVIFHPFHPARNELIFEDRTLKVSTIPLKHRVPSAGFLLEEKPKSPHIIREMIDFYQVPVSRIHAIKNGMDYITPEGEIIPHQRLTRPAEPAHRYAYCSDTAYYEKIIPIIEGVDVLYHEATFGEEDLARAKETFHSSARQAASIAKAANVKKLVLGHFSARYPDETILLNEAREIFPNTILANEKLLINLSI
ncbi:ribonuclease Z [Bacteroidia bacterium]|nr:ribonuclease Z [Bacteroidia bacterium]GHT45723.1 ribonuclease Z [Bacteroidia bacterium]